MTLSMAVGTPGKLLVLLVCTMAVAVLSKPDPPSSPDDSSNPYAAWASDRDKDFPENDYGGSNKESDKDGADYRGGGGYDDSKRVSDWMARVNSKPAGWEQYLNQRKRDSQYIFGDSEIRPQGPRRAQSEDNKNSRHPFDTHSGGYGGGYGGGYEGGYGSGNEGGYGGGYGSGNEGGYGGGNEGGYGGGYKSGGESYPGYADWARGHHH